MSLTEKAVSSLSPEEIKLALFLKSVCVLREYLVLSTLIKNLPKQIKLTESDFFQKGDLLLKVNDSSLDGLTHSQVT